MEACASQKIPWPFGLPIALISNVSTTHPTQLHCLALEALQPVHLQLEIRRSISDCDAVIFTAYTLHRVMSYS